MQKRMGMQRNSDYMEKVSRIISTFTGLAKAGVPPEEALDMTAQAMQGMEMPGTPPVEMPPQGMGMEMPPEEDEMMY
jgi:hypothetical protein